jgi:hypothetical protein
MSSDRAATVPISVRAIQAIEQAVDAARRGGAPLWQELINSRLYVIWDDVRIYPSKHIAAMLFTVADVD